MRYIAIDTEYFCDPQTATNYSRSMPWNKLKNALFAKLHCIAATTSDGKTFKRWFKPEEAIETICEFLRELDITKANLEETVFIVHSWELAEGTALRHILRTFLAELGEKTVKEIFYKVKVIDTCLLARMIFRVYSELDKDKVKCDYASLCKSLLHVGIDTEHKTLMREYCITDLTSGHEEEILDYCLSDTQYLIPLYKELRRRYIELYNHGVPVNFHHYDAFKDEKYKNKKLDFKVWKDFLEEPLEIDEEQAEEKILNVCHYINLYVYINGNGIPVDVELVNKLKTKWLAVTEAAVEYYGLKDYRKKTRSDVSLCLKKLKADALKELKDLNAPFKWPLTDSGALSTDKDDEITFSETGQKLTVENFIKQFCQEADSEWSNLLVVRFKKFDNEKRLIKTGANFFRHVDEQKQIINYGCSNVYSAITGRAQGKPSAGSIPHASHAIHCLMKAPKDKILFEMDLSAAETYIAGALTRDLKLLDAYKQKDIYLYLATLINPSSKYYVPAEEYFSYVDSGRYEELKEKYSSQRKALKGTFLGVQYGMGIKTLASRLGISEQEALELRSQFKVQGGPEGGVEYGDQIMFEVDRFQACIFQPSQREGETRELSKTAQWYNATMADRKALVFKSGYLAKFDRNRSHATSVRNFPTQGGCAQILFNAVDRLFKNDKITIHCTIHDAIICSCNKEDFEQAQKDITEAFQAAACDVLNLPDLDPEDKFKMKCEWAISSDEHIETDKFIYNKLTEKD